MLSIENVSLSYSGNFKVIKGFSRQYEKGNIYGLVGLNGAGKTTLLNAIYGFKSVDKGTIAYDGEDVSPKHIAYLETSNFFYSNITGAEYLRLFKNENFKVEDWNALLNIPLNRLIENYSTGMKKKLAFLAIMKLDKPVLILDEPFSGMDLESVRIIHLILLELKKTDKIVLITSHILESLIRLCDWIDYLETGQIIMTKEQSEFDTLEERIFGDIEERNSEKIQRLM